MTIGVILPFVLSAIGDYVVQFHTRDGRLAMYAIRHSARMTDQELARAIGDDPFAVLRRAGMMSSAVTPIVVLLCGAFAALIERRSPGRMALLAVTPFLLWDFSMSAFSVPHPPALALLAAGRVLGVDALYAALAGLAALSATRVLRSDSKGQTFSVPSPI
jgi:hypothetical protein